MTDKLTFEKLTEQQLLELLDVGARRLLAHAGVGDTVTDMPDAVATLAERVKAFDSVVDWAKTRKGLIPEQKKESAFGQLSAEFHGDAPARRRSSRRSVAPASVGGDGAAGGLFDDDSDQPNGAPSLNS